MGLATATLGFAAGLTTIVLYGVAGPEFQEWLGLSSAMLGVLLASPHLSKAVLRVPFGAWVDAVGGRKPLLTLLILTVVGVAGVAGVLLADYPEGAGPWTLPLLLAFGLLAGAGGATFSVGVPKTSYWFPIRRQGWALGVYAGAGNVTPGVFNYLIPVMIGAWGLTAAYSLWLGFLVLATVLYALYAVDAYYFQLVARGTAPSEAKTISRTLGQELFPSGGARASLVASARNPRTWILVFLYSVSFGGGFTALTAWLPTYWALFHGQSLVQAGLLAAFFTVYGSLIRIPGGRWSDRFGGESVAVASFSLMLAGALVLTFSFSALPAFVGMIVLGTGMGVANAAVFELVPAYVPEAVGGASGWIGGIGGAGTLVIVPALGMFVDVLGQPGYAWGFVMFVVLAGVCATLAFGLGRSEELRRS